MISATGFLARFSGAIVGLLLLTGPPTLAQQTGEGQMPPPAVVVSGMLAATVIGLFIIPILYAVIQRITKWAVRKANSASEQPVR